MPETFQESTTYNTVDSAYNVVVKSTGISTLYVEIRYKRSEFARNTTASDKSLGTLYAELRYIRLRYKRSRLYMIGVMYRMPETLQESTTYNT